MIETNRSAQRAAFTLLELLVVIAIIALLIGILIPALGKARDAGRQAVCLSNQRQIGMSVVFYSQEWDDYIPRDAGTDDGSDEVNPRWTFALRPYMDDRYTQDRDDPVQDDFFENFEYYQDPARPEDAHNVHYVINVMRFREPGVALQVGKPPTKLGLIARPTDTLYLTCFSDDESRIFERVWINQSATTWDMAVYYDVFREIQINRGGFSYLTHLRIQADRHGSGANATFLDGHAEALPKDELETLETWDDGDYR